MIRIFRSDNLKFEMTKELWKKGIQPEACNTKNYTSIFNATI